MKSTRLLSITVSAVLLSGLLSAQPRSAVADDGFVDIFNGKDLSGYFSLQDHGRKIEFRNVRLKEL